jgi:hypothetical protein
MPRSRYLEFLRIALHALCHGGHRRPSFLRTGSGFDWFSCPCLKRKSPAVQVWVTSFSRTSLTLLLADLREIKDIAVKRVHEVGRSKLFTYKFEVAYPCATPCAQSTGAFNHQKPLWNLRSQSRVPRKRFQVLTLRFDDWSTFGNWKPRLRIPSKSKKK